jgi:hypothetical protein
MLGVNDRVGKVIVDHIFGRDAKPGLRALRATDIPKSMSASKAANEA